MQRYLDGYIAASLVALGFWLIGLSLFPAEAATWLMKYGLIITSVPTLAKLGIHIRYGMQESTPYLNMIAGSGIAIFLTGVARSFVNF